LSKSLMRRSKKEQKEDVINYIKHNPSCSVIDIHENVRVNISRLFGSILNAYSCAGVKYVEKEITSGVRNPFVVQRCIQFEQKIISLLGKIGQVVSKIRIKNYIVDGIFRYKNKTFIVEIKDYRGHNNITMSEIKQLLRYMGALNCNNGLLICPEESFPKRKNGRNIVIGKMNIKILSEEDILFLDENDGDTRI